MICQHEAPGMVPAARAWWILRVPVFEYTALSSRGERIAGSLSGASEQAVLSELESRQLVPVSISSREERRPLLRRFAGGGISKRRLATTYSQVSDLLRAGVPLLRALNLMANRRSQPRLSAIFRELSEAVSQGEELAEAMSSHPEVFPRVHIAMVRAGEKGGFLEGVLARLGQFVMRQAELRGKVIGNLVYPTFLVVFGLIVLLVVFGFFVPMFRPMFDEMPSLPAITTMVLAASSLVASYGPISAGILGILAVVLWRISRRPGAQRTMAEMRTRAPIIGPLIRSLAAARFCRMLGTMLSNGIPMLTAMQIAREAAGNVLMEEAIGEAAEAVRAGQPLAGPLGESKLFDEEVLEMISVAESANNLDEVLITIAESLEASVDRLLTGVIRLIEPVMLLAIALVVLVVATALILPLSNVSADF
jgi:general secretion pathway protein F